MTQISAIYAKRSRSILNQFGQTNIGAHVHVNHVAHGNHAVHSSNNNHLSPNQNINQGRGSVGNTDNHDHHNNSKGSPRLGRLRGISPQSREKNYASNSGNASNAGANNSSFPSAQVTAASHHGQGNTAPVASASPNTGVISASATHSNHPSYPNSSNQSGQNNMNAAATAAVVNGVAPNSQVGASNVPSNLSNIMSTHTSTSFQNSQSIVVSGGAAANGVNSAGPAGGSSADNTHLHISQQHGVPMSSSSHHSHATAHSNQDRINHSSPNKGPGNSSTGINSAAANNAAINMVGSQAGSIQQGSVGGISGIGGISGMSSSGARPSMNQTGHGKSFPYSMHRKTNSNKLPHIGSSNSKDNTS